MDGDEVAQVYFKHANASGPQPKQALCSFARIHLDSGKAANLTVNIPVNRFRYWDAAQQKYVVDSGNYELLVGAASDDIRLQISVKIIVPPAT